MSFFFGDSIWDHMWEMQRQLESLSEEVEHRPRGGDCRCRKVTGAPASSSTTTKKGAAPACGSKDKALTCGCDSECKAMESFFNPSTDLAETADSYVVSMDLPGVKKEEVNVSVHDGVLTVSGVRHHQFMTPEKGEEKEEEPKKEEEKKEETPAATAAAAETETDKKEEEPKKEEKKEEAKKEEPKKLTHKIIRMESYYGSFERNISVPAGTKSSDVSAKFENGVLTVKIAKPHKEEPKKIEIQ